MSKIVRCMRTGKDVNLDKGCFVGNTQNGQWEFVSIDAPEKSVDYNMDAEDFFSSPEKLIDWLGHISEKTWFDSQLFFSFIHDFRRSNNIYG